MWSRQLSPWGSLGVVVPQQVAVMGVEVYGTILCFLSSRKRRRQMNFPEQFPLF
jgi:hypothetical protein